MNRTISLLAAAGAALLLAAPASTQTGTTLTIRHQLRGCHTWSVNGGAFRPAQAVTLTKGSTITVVNNDVMPHKLVLVSGPALTLSRSANMNHAGAKTTIRFTKAGVYKFRTKAGEDYMKGVKTIGEDNTLKIKVIVGGAPA
jgi:plastocyanin